MRIYFFSKKHNKLKQLNSKKLIMLLLFPLIVFLTMSATILHQLFFSSTSLLQKENRKLKESLANLSERFSGIQNSLNQLYHQEKKLRIASNVNITDDAEFGIGGADESIISLSKDGDISAIDQLAEIISGQINYQLENFNKLTDKISENESLVAHIPAIVPMYGVFSEHSFGMRVHPIIRRWKMHEGIDILGNHGDPIFATGSGKVTHVGWSGGYGLTIEIDHGFGYKTLYGHLSRAHVKEGQQIKRYQVIGSCGSTGLSTGPHVHYEVSFNGEKQDPVNYILN
ncbi:MAG: M23 family metallopeptidase [Ignavibacteria bacterium]|nr:M23 family metallopeptidase [Ignavibacteria bacterium]